MTLSYHDAGVDLDVAEAVTAGIKQHLRGTLFGGFLPVPQLKAYDSPVLVSSIDGVGTKVHLAARLGQVERLGHDIVFHCVNDIAVHGAVPLQFLDYIAMHRLDTRLIETIVKSVADACASIGLQLAGGETAEMPLVYPPDRFDLAGAIVGVAEQSAIVDGTGIRAGDVLLGIPSSGLHTNGYSLVQRLFQEHEYSVYEPELGTALGDALLEPHLCYLEDIQMLLRTGSVHGMAHITGGGIASNLGRILPGDLRAVVNLPEPPPLFNRIARCGVSKEEMRRVFNMGIGLIAVCDGSVLARLPASFEVIGEITSGERDVEFA